MAPTKTVRVCKLPLLSELPLPSSVPSIRYSADTLNAHLASGGIVQVTTYARSTVYYPRNAGDFRESPHGTLLVRRGKNWDALSIGERLLLGIRLGRLK